MGIEDLANLIAEHAPKDVKYSEMKNYFGRKVAIDASMALYQTQTQDCFREIEHTNDFGIYRSLSDLPPEILTLIFLHLDSVSRKQAERVCKGWMQILREDRKLRTHVQVDISDRIWNHTFRHFGPETKHALYKLLEPLITPDLEVLHMAGFGDDTDSEWSYILERVIGEVFKKKQVGISQVTLIISNCTFLYHMNMMWDTEPAFKDVILRNVQLIYYWSFGFRRLRIWFDVFTEKFFAPEVILIPEHGSCLRHLMNRAIPCESGPLSKEDSDALLQVEAHISLPDVIDDFTEEIKYVLDGDLPGIFRDISRGVGVDKIHSDFLLRFMEKLLTTEPSVATKEDED